MGSIIIIVIINNLRSIVLWGGDSWSGKILSVYIVTRIPRTWKRLLNQSFFMTQEIQETPLSKRRMLLNESAKMDK